MAEGRRLKSTGLLVYERMERGERDRVRVVFQVLERVKAAPRRDASGEPETDVVVEESVESVEH